MTKEAKMRMKYIVELNEDYNLFDLSDALGKIGVVWVNEYDTIINENQELKDLLALIKGMLNDSEYLANAIPSKKETK